MAVRRRREKKRKSSFISEGEWECKSETKKGETNWSGDKTTEEQKNRTTGGESRSRFTVRRSIYPFPFSLSLPRARISTSASPTFDFCERRLCRENCHCISNGLITTIFLNRQRALLAPEFLRKPWKFHQKEKEKERERERERKMENPWENQPARWKLTRSPFEVTPMRSGFSSPIQYRAITFDAQFN